MRAPVVSGRDASPVLEPAEHALDEVAAFVEVLVVGDGLLSVLAPGDAGLDLLLREGLAEPVAVIAPVGDKPVGLWQGGQYGRGTAIVTDLTLGQQQYQRFAVPVANRVQLRVQAALGASDTPGKAPFLSRLAAVRCAFRWVASIITVSVASLAEASSEKMRSKTPISLQRTNRL